MKSADYFCSNHAHRQTNRQTDRADRITSAMTELIMSKLITDELHVQALPYRLREMAAGGTAIIDPPRREPVRGTLRGSANS